MLLYELEGGEDLTDGFPRGGTKEIGVVDMESICSDKEMEVGFELNIYENDILSRSWSSFARFIYGRLVPKDGEVVICDEFGVVLIGL